MLTGFNGATAFRRWIHVPEPSEPLDLMQLQWGHRLSAMDTSPGAGRPRIASLLQWGHRLSAMDTLWNPTEAKSPPHSFNGATAFRRWIRPTADSPGLSGPGFNGATAFRRWIRSGALGCCARPPWCFNGATAFRRWILPTPPLVWRLHTELQWGHRLSAMDTSGGYARGISSIEASMGPPPFGDGYRAEVAAMPQTYRLLQWGHRLSAMDTR